VELKLELEGMLGANVAFESNQSGIETPYTKELTESFAPFESNQSGIETLAPEVWQQQAELV